MHAYLVDTNILVELIRAKDGWRELLESLLLAGGDLACSAIALAELHAGMRPHERDRTEALLNEFRHLDVTPPIARLGGSLKAEWAARGFKLTLSDAMIAATAITHNLVLVTTSPKDFPMPEVRLYPRVNASR
jgi:predicted nucleic acid-binding protein